MTKKKVWHATRYPGVRFREHPSRKHGIPPDKYFTIVYRHNGKVKSEAIGWASEKWTAEKAATELSELRRNQRRGSGPQTMAEKRELEQQRREAEQAEKIKKELEAVTLGQYFEDTYLPKAQQNKKPSSYNAELIYYQKWIKPVIGARPFKQIEQIQIESIVKNLLKAGRAPRTIEYICAIIRQCWNSAKNDNLTDRDCPTKRVKKPAINNDRQRFFSHEQAQTLLDHIKIRSEQTFHFCLVSLHCGLRASEIFNLRWMDINTDDGTIFISDPKGKKSRYAYMTEAVKKLFSGMDRGAPEELVFKNRNGEKVQRISNVFQRSVKDLKLNGGISDPRQKICFHSCRHTFASWLAMSGVDLYTIQKLMGHRSFDMVQRYSHLGENTLQAAVKSLDMAMNERKVIPLNRTAQND